VSGFREAVEKAVEEFNRYHGVEARVEVVEWFEDGFVAEFRGSFCLTCGFYDYFDDLARLVKELGYEANAVKVEEFEGGALVEYRVLKGEERQRALPEKLILIFEWKRR
jgi:hypothetical protein